MAEGEDPRDEVIDVKPTGAHADRVGVGDGVAPDSNGLLLEEEEAHSGNFAGEEIQEGEGEGQLRVHVGDDCERRGGREGKRVFVRRKKEGVGTRWNINENV